MIASEEEQDKLGSSVVQEVTDAVESGIEQLVSVLKKLDLKVNVNVPPVDQKTPVIELTAELPDIHIPEPQPHPFRYGLIVTIDSRDSNGDIKKFTIKPAKP